MTERTSPKRAMCSRASCAPDGMPPTTNFWLCPATAAGPAPPPRPSTAAAPICGRVAAVSAPRLLFLFLTGSGSGMGGGGGRQLGYWGLVRCGVGQVRAQGQRWRGWDGLGFMRDREDGDWGAGNLVLGFPLPGTGMLWHVIGGRGRWRDKERRYLERRLKCLAWRRGGSGVGQVISSGSKEVAVVSDNRRKWEASGVTGWETRGV
jgi:hypothetical protein